MSSFEEKCEESSKQAGVVGVRRDGFFVCGDPLPLPTLKTEIDGLSVVFKSAVAVNGHWGERKNMGYEIATSAELPPPPDNRGKYQRRNWEKEKAEMDGK